MPETAPREGWREDPSAVFIGYGRAFTPERERQQEIISVLIADLAPARLVMELCCGSGDLAKLLLERLPRIHLRAFDGSPRMLEKPRRPALPMAIACICSRFIWPRGTGATCSRRPMRSAPRSRSIIWTAHRSNGCSVIFSPSSDQSGLFVLADLIRPASEASARIAAEDWDHAVAARSQALYGDDRARRRFEELRWNYFRWPTDNGIDHPSTIPEHVSWLAAAGFEVVDLHWLFAGHAILSARKP
jgi:tRNA (cmo5U34)-methyltransferase